MLPEVSESRQVGSARCNAVAPELEPPRSPRLLAPSQHPRHLIRNAAKRASPPRAPDSLSASLHVSGGRAPPGVSVIPSRAGSADSGAAPIVVVVEAGVPGDHAVDRVGRG